MNGSFKRTASALIFAILATGAGFLKAQDFTGKTVLSIVYEPPQQPVYPQDLEKMQLVHVGQPLDPRQVATTVDRLWASGLYDDIQVDAEPSGSGVEIRFITQPRRFIGHVGAEGHFNAPPAREVVISYSQLSLGSTFNPEDVESARKIIEEQMRDNGLYNAAVAAATVEDPDTHQVTIRFLVEAGKRAKYEMPVITGDKKLSDDTIVHATGWRIPVIHWWRHVTAAQTDKGTEGIQKKYGKIGRLTTEVNLTSLDYDNRTNRVQPHLDINGGPKIEIKAVEAKVSKGKLRDLVPVWQEGTVDNDLLSEGAGNLHDYFQSKGYPDVDVTWKTEPPKNDLQVINYYIATGPRRRLADVTIRGGNYFMPSTIRERMFLKPASLLMKYGRYSETFRESDEQAIAALYRDNGFRNVKVTSTVQTNFKGKPNDIGVTFQIDEGKQWTVKTLQIEGSSRLDISSIRNQLYSQEGQPFAEVDIAADRNTVLSYYYSHGFPAAAFQHSVVIRQDQTINLTYRITEGPQEFIRKVVLSGLYRTRPSILEKRITLKDGEPISMVKINDIAREFSNYGIFSNVNTALQDANGATQYKYVLYDFDEAARWTFNVGLGAEIGQFGGTTQTLSNAGGAKGLSPLVSFNVNRLNFLGRGDTISLTTRYSTLEQREALSYIMPRIWGSLNRTLSFTVLYDTTQDVQTFSSRREEASVQLSQRLNRASTLSLQFAYRRVSTENVVIPSLLIPALLQPVRIGILSASYIQDHRDNPADAHHGFWNTLDTGLAGNFFGSQRNFVRVLGRNATYTSIGRKFVLARQTQIGAILPFNIPAGLPSFDAVPLPERFFGGGSVSMRGFGDNQAGPRDIGTLTELPGSPMITPNPTGFPIGGNALFFNTVELRFPLLGPNISGVLFEDMGNIYTTFDKISLAYHQASNQDFNYAVQAPGFGIRYKTPLGPIRVDFSYALNPPRFLGFNTNETIQQLLACTPQEIGVLPSCTATPQQLSHFQFFFSIGQAF